MRSVLRLIRSRPTDVATGSTSRALLTACSIGALLALADPVAAGPGRLAPAAEAQYRQERAACMNGQTHQDRATCLREAAAALQEARRGTLDGGASAYDQNRTARCQPLPPDLRGDCERRMRGEGTTSGSVEAGGIYRELHTTVPAS